MLFTMNLLLDIIAAKLPRRFRSKRVEIVGSQRGSIDCSSSDFLIRKPVGGELVVNRYYVTESNALRFDRTLTIPIPRKHWCHIGPKNRYHGSIGTLVRYWDQGTYKTSDDDQEDCVLILTRIQVYFE